MSKSNIDNDRRRIAAEASGVTTERFAHDVRGLLMHSRCRDTASKPVFSAEVIGALSHGPKVSRHG